jgi:hypothetical protein
MTKYVETQDAYGDLSAPACMRRLLTDILNEPVLAMWDHRFDLDHLLGQIKAPTLAAVLDAIYSDYAQAHGKVRWGDKSDYLDRLYLIHRVFPNAKFIHIIRDGRDVAQSVLKLKWGPDDVIRAAEWWNNHVWVGRRMGAILGPEQYLEVRYERLVTNPEEQLRRCCEFLHEEYSPQMLDYYNDSAAAIPTERREQHKRFDSPPDLSRVFAWKREMHKADVVLFGRHARRMLRELGYELPEPGVNKLQIGWRMATIAMKRFGRAFRTDDNSGRDRP